MKLFRSIERGRKTGCVILATILLTALCGCGQQQKVSYIRHEEPVYLGVGEHAVLELDNIPEGKTAEDFNWSALNDIAEVTGGVVTGVQTHPSYLSGTTSVTAELNYKGTTYREYFTVVVEKTAEKIEFKYPSITMLRDDVIYLSYETEPETLSKGQRVIWNVKNEEIVELADGSSPVNGMASSNKKVKAASAGTTEITVQTRGAEDICTVKVFDIPETADEKLAYLCSWQDSYESVGELRHSSAQSDRTKSSGVTILFSELPEDFGMKKAGKYMVIWDYESNSGNETAKALLDGNRLPYSEKAFCDYTAAIPLELRPEKWSDVEFIVCVREGKPIQQGLYEGGVRAMERVVDITLETTDGEILETLRHVYGELPGKIYVKESEPLPEVYFSSAPLRDKAESYLTSIIKGLQQ